MNKAIKVVYDCLWLCGHESNAIYNQQLFSYLCVYTFLKVKQWWTGDSAYVDFLKKWTFVRINVHGPLYAQCDTQRDSLWISLS